MTVPELKALLVVLILACVWAARDDRRWLYWLRSKLRRDAVIGSCVPDPARGCRVIGPGAP